METPAGTLANRGSSYYHNRQEARQGCVGDESDYSALSVHISHEVRPDEGEGSGCPVPRIPGVATGFVDNGSIQSI